MHKLKQEQFLPISLDQAWDFFATPRNLNEVTPDDMVFEITSELPDKMYEGLMTDLLHYDIGKSFIGWIAGKVFVHNKVKDIFAYRHKSLETYFSS